MRDPVASINWAEKPHKDYRSQLKARVDCESGWYGNSPVEELMRKLGMPSVLDSGPEDKECEPNKDPVAPVRLMVATRALWE